MEMWINKEKCTGCAACANICPVKAIFMNEDEYGFLYPKISDGCINCGACKKVCEQRKKLQRENALDPKIFAAWSQNEEVRFNSTSGGVFSELANYILAKGGYVVGAQYGNCNVVEHVAVNTKQDLDKIRQSKYTQSNIGEIFKEIKKLLTDGKLVAFCGTPCQAAGLYSYLGEEYENLYTFDFICRGVNSPKAYRSWFKEIEDRYKKKISKIWFKYKKYGWKKSPWCTRIDFEDGNYIVQYKKKNLFMLGYLSLNLYMRSSCGDCDFKGIPRRTDITLADFWGLDSTLDDDAGTTMVLVNSEKGLNLLGHVSNALKLHKRKLEEVQGGNECFQSSVSLNPRGERFLEELSQQCFSRLVKKYIRANFIQQWKERIRRKMQ